VVPLSTLIVSGVQAKISAAEHQEPDASSTAGLKSSEKDHLLPANQPFGLHMQQLCSRCNNLPVDIKLMCRPLDDVQRNSKTATNTPTSHKN